MGILVRTTPIPSGAYADALREIADDIPVWTEKDAPAPEDVEAILAWRMPGGVLPCYPNLRVLCSIGAGVDALLATPDLAPDVIVTRVVDPAQAVEIAQFVVGGALHFTRDLSSYARQQTRAQWRRLPVRPMSRCRVGVMGLGRVGRAIARAFLPLGYPVAGWSRSPQTLDEVEVYHGQDALRAFVKRTDILVCALPLTALTRGMLNRELLAQLPVGSIVVNVGRGEHLIESDLRSLLDAGHLGAAVLDVFEQEPVPADNWVWSHPQVLATPHIASSPGKRIVAEQCVDALRRARLGLPQPQRVDRSAGY